MSTKFSVLMALQENSGSYVSGEELSRKLDVSRTAIWKAINSLRSEGFNIESATNKGYMLISQGKILTESSVRDALSSSCKDIEMHIFDTIDSTNIEAKKLALTGKPGGTVVISRQQNAGRGRLGRSFFSPPEGLYLSIIIRPDFDVSQAVLITSAAAVAVAEAIEEVTGKSAQIKWVNDIYVDGKKVCGILTEGISDIETGRIQTLVTGIGLNTTVKDFPAELLETAGAVEGDYSISRLAAAIISRTLDYAASIQDRTFIEGYRAKSMVMGETVTVYKGRYKINPEDEILGRTAKVLGIDDDGGLDVMYSDGTREVLTSGEITLRF